MFDLYHHVPIAEILTDKENIPIVHDFIKQNIEQKDRTAGYRPKNRLRRCNERIRI